MTSAICDSPALVPASPPRTVPFPGLACILALSLLLAACGDKNAKPAAAEQPPEVGVVTLQPERRVVTTELPGRTTAFLSAEIRPQVGGIVQKRLFTEGARVAAGQVLYQLDPAPYEVALASAEAQLARARATLNTARTNARRNAELVKIDAVSRQVYDDSQAAVAQAQADAGVAAAAVEAARINLGYTRIKSPIAGLTTTSAVTPGALVTANQAAALTTVSQIDPLYVDVTQSSSEVLRLKGDLAAGRFKREGKGDARVAIKLDDGSTYAQEAVLRFSGVQVNPATGAITLRAVVPNPEGVLMPGMYVQALLPTGLASDALLIPQQAVNRDLTGRANVLVVNADDVVEKRPVELARALGSRWLVDSGLAAGERLVVDGFQRVKPGDKVSPQAVDLNARNGGAKPPQAPEDGLRPRNGQGVNIATPQAGAPR